MSKSATIIDPIMPGEILASEFLEPMNISARKLAGHIGVPANRITEIIKGRRSITGDTALRLSKAFGTTPESGSISKAIMNWNARVMPQVI